MAATVRTLLENALYLSISDREFSPVEPGGSKINAALNTFIDLLDVWRDQVPFYSERDIEGESELANVDAADVNYVDYILGNVVYPLVRVSQLEFSRLDTIVGLRAIPYYYWHDKQENRINVYPLPQSSSDKFRIGITPLLSIESLDQPLPASIQPFMKLFLEYDLAMNLCNQFNQQWTPTKEATRMRYYQKLLENAENAVSYPDKPLLGKRGYPIPWLAYVSGNTPGAS